MSDRNGHVVASFPIAHRDQIMLVTDRGQLIRNSLEQLERQFPDVPEVLEMVEFIRAASGKRGISLRVEKEAA